MGNLIRIPRNRHIGKSIKFLITKNNPPIINVAYHLLKWLLIDIYIIIIIQVYKMDWQIDADQPKVRSKHIIITPCACTRDKVLSRAVIVIVVVIIISTKITISWDIGI